MTVSSIRSDKRTQLQLNTDERVEKTISDYNSDSAWF